VSNRRVAVSDELGWMWKEAYMYWYCFKVLSQHLIGDIEECIKVLYLDIWLLGQALFPGPPQELVITVFAVFSLSLL
jgi:hypothetical protein